MRHLEDILTLGSRILIGGIFLIAGLVKVQDPGAFADAVRAYHLLPPGLVVPFALIVPWLEILVAAYLLAGFLTRIGAAGSALLLATFVVALTDALATGNTAHSCGCFGSGGANPILGFLAGGNSITPWDPIRDVILIGLSLWLVVRGAGRYSADALLARRREAEGLPDGTGRRWMTGA